MNFNLVDSPFIPCLRIDGSRVELGLQDVLRDAHELAEIRDESPLVTAALHRLLLAILHRCFGPRTTREREKLLLAGRFDPEPLRAYFDRWRDRFDLFDPARPFYQAAGWQQEPDKRSSISRLAQELSRGNNAAIFDHTVDDDPPALTPGQAAQVLIAEQAWAVGGGKSDTGNTTHAPLVGGATILVQGSDLFRTLWSNLTLYDLTKKQPVASTDSDCPWWERDDLERPHACSKAPDGYLDYLTWQSRTLRLHPEQQDDRVTVSWVSYAQGRRLETEPGFYEPMMAYLRDEKTGDRPVRLSEWRALWRDSASLFQFAETDQSRGPTTLQTLGTISEDVLPRSTRHRIATFGLCTDKAKVSFWRNESLPLPLVYLDQPPLVGSLKKALELAEQIARDALRPAVWAFASAVLTGNEGMSPDKSRVGQVVESLAAERSYWSTLELPFRQLLVDLPGDAAHREEKIEEWGFDTLRDRAMKAFEATVGKLDAPRELRAATKARGVLHTRLNKILPRRNRVAKGAVS